MAKTVVALFKDEKLANRAIGELESLGIESKDISIVLRDEKIERDLSESTGANVAGGAMSGATTGGVLGALAGLLIANGIFPGLGTFLIGGPLAATLGLTGAVATIISGVATGALAGTLIGALMGFGLTENEARMYESELKAGAIFIAVPTADVYEGEIVEILSDYNATQIKVLNVPSDKVIDERLSNHLDSDMDFTENYDYTHRPVHVGMKGGVARSPKRGR